MPGTLIGLPATTLHQMRAAVIRVMRGMLEIGFVHLYDPATGMRVGSDRVNKLEYEVIASTLDEILRELHGCDCSAMWREAGRLYINTIHMGEARRIADQLCELVTRRSTLVLSRLTLPQD